MPQTHTDTEEALEDEFGVKASQPYALRADQLADGAYRYALEQNDTGQILAEGVDPVDQKALEKFEQSLAKADLTREERRALLQALLGYEHHLEET